MRRFFNKLEEETIETKKIAEQAKIVNSRLDEKASNEKNSRKMKLLD